MALLVWLPLNGNTNNQGVSDIKMTSGSSVSFDSNGKIGKCLICSGNINNAIYDANISTVLNYTDNFSWALWVNTNFTSGSTQYAFTVGRADAGSYGYGMGCISTTQCKIKFGSAGYDVNVTGGEWTHISFTKKGNIITIYKNGSLYSSHTFNGTLPTYLNTEASGLGVGCFYYGGNNKSRIYPFYGKINDVRIYDHCLSPKEVKEISKGLILHYPLNNFYEIGLTNKYSGDYAEGYFSTISGFTSRTKLSNERGYKYILNYTGNGNNNWPNLNVPVFNFTVGKKYYYSLKVRCNTWTNGYLYLRASRSLNDWATNLITICKPSLADGLWHEYYVSQTINSTYDRDGTTITCAPLLELFTSNLNEDGTIYNFDFDIKDIQVVESDCYIPFIDNNMTNTAILDCSGYNNNGTITGVLNSVSNTPRYNYSTKFNGHNCYFLVKNPFYNNIQPLTIAFWFKTNSSNASYNTVISNYPNPHSGFWLSVNTEDSGLWSYYGNYFYVYSLANILNDIWYHIVWLYKGNNEYQWYLNGNEVTTTKKGTAKAPVFTEYINIGGCYCSDSATSSNKYDQYGDISDLRIYTTALSESDIKELYNTSGYITSNGAVCGYEFDEFDNNVNINKEGIIESPLFIEETAMPTSITITGSGVTSFTPGNNVVNSCSNGYNVIIEDVSIEKKYTVELDFLWSGTWGKSSDGNLDVWMLGSSKPVNSTSYDWNGVNPITTALNNYKRPQALINASPSGGTFHYKTLFTIPADYSRNGWNIGTRTDYSDGNGTLSYSNLKIYPYSANLDTESCKIAKDYITSKQFIEI